ncbi:MAG TPA: hypothetical protein PLX07_14010 [Microthrixaceae bacterium]|nr:hypothetical protein [Microthrixaceae bacterium]
MGSNPTVSAIGPLLRQGPELVPALHAARRTCRPRVVGATVSYKFGSAR